MAKRILLIEDDQMVREILEKKFLEQGYETIIVLGGREGLMKAQSAKPDLILIDISMPKMAGLEAMEKIAMDQNLKNIPVIAISNSGQPDEISQAKELGAKGLVLKTEFDPQNIINKVIEKIGK